MSATIPGHASLAAFPTAFSGGSSTPTAGVYYAVPPMGEPGREGVPEYEEILASFPGVDGVGTKRLGFRARKIVFEIIIVGADRSACETSKNAIFDAATALARYSVKVEGGTERQGCKLVRGAGIPERSYTITDKICLVVPLVFIQLSETN